MAAGLARSVYKNNSSDYPQIPRVDNIKQRASLHYRVEAIDS